ncbi:Undecaprenyl-phosphate galactosephosphotransferase [hydrothermal vent metagenome]|uniref:Undecaprenyl-phosphate galactosephosphotransferase n=1 Tax=hydrothermal vent metagenome TaxID=652676 RepID=A0A3B0RUC3_9ZZZZ
MLSGEFNNRLIGAVDVPATVVQPVDVRVASPIYVRFVKPVFDRVGGLVLSVLTLPLIIPILLAIRLTMGKHPLFVQERVGKDGDTFKVFKLRTMNSDRRAIPMHYVGPDRRITHKSEHDPRVTPLGGFLRKYSLDELPQFWNVLLGSMSLVGPRPELVDIVNNYEPWQHQRHIVRPGITGLWQVSERGEIPLHEATDVDLVYLKNLSFGKDLAILIRTIPAAMGKRTGF